MKSEKKPVSTYIVTSYPVRVTLDGNNTLYYLGSEDEPIDKSAMMAFAKMLAKAKGAKMDTVIVSEIVKNKEGKE
jgi:hypothetical protein